MNLLHEPAPRSNVSDHLVQVYRDAGELADAVARYLSAGFEAGEPAVAVATAAHWPLFAERLQKRGWDPEALQAQARLCVADADVTLEAVLEHGKPSLRRFTSVIGGLLDRAANGSPRQRVRVFGEMVDILSRRGEAESADALEDFWNRLGLRRNFTLLCGYKLDVFDRDTELHVLPQVCRSHTHVQTASDAERMDRAVDAALVETLGYEDAMKVYALATRGADGRSIPAAQLALMWVSAQMPRSAERILATARSRYETPAAA